ncbi:GNAT family N-acetyltransferase [Lacticigenium naphthae]|uniref:GNAT family N-acetyltransferase n=1 Tax=Lacticigenium naphthae TaxID=515351 RepID=UPI0004141776|nr:GNAT family N-acetyltransferase [Lacticigenium naphthae]
MKIHLGNEIWNQAGAFSVRMAVFVVERGIALQEEFDSVDEKKPNYIVIYDENHPIATGRYSMKGGVIRPGRIAVLASQRKKGLGKVIVEEIEKIGKDAGCRQSLIHGEMTAVPFYEKIGYVQNSTRFIEDGVECIKLIKDI